MSTVVRCANFVVKLSKQMAVNASAAGRRNRSLINNAPVAVAAKPAEIFEWLGERPLFDDV